MNRIKIQLPEGFGFYTEFSIRITDLNYGGHAGNDRFLALIQEARQAFLESKGYTELSVEGYGLIMADAVVEYKKELNYKDRIRIWVKASDFDKVGFDIFYRMEVWRDEEWQLAGRAKTGMIAYDYTAKKKVSLTEAAIQNLSN
jgi:acyl-CoA thioester hydrolase